LRAAFHVGAHFEFYQSLGHTPDTREYIVGESTISTVRFLERALPGQFVIGNFGSEEKPSRTPAFLREALTLLAGLTDLHMSHAQVTRIQAYLTGTKQPDGSFAPTRFIIADKHKLRLKLFNARGVIELQTGDKIFIGLPASGLAGFNAERTTL